MEVEEFVLNKTMPLIRLVLIALMLFFFSFAKGQKPIYTGGDGDGSANACYTEDLAAGWKIFFGGDGDGSAIDCYTEDLAAGWKIFFGGDGDGFDLACYEEDLTLVFGVFTGGNGDGSAISCYIQDKAAGTQFFFGGNGDGSATACYTQNQAEGTQIFFGGDGDGSTINCYLQPPYVRTLLFYGGNGDGFAIDCFDETFIPTFGVYTGGDGDGSATTCYLQTDYLIQIGILPIELIYFHADLLGRDAKLSWQTTSEINNDYFLVEKSHNLIDWQKLKPINGAGNSIEILNYETIDKGVLFNSQGVIYYRLKQVDFDRQFTYSQVQALTIDNTKQSTVLTYPNPASDKVNIQFNGFNTDYLLLTLYNSNGKLVYQENIELFDGVGLYIINRTPTMPSGFYYIVVNSQNSNNSPIVKKLILR